MEMNEMDKVLEKVNSNRIATYQIEHGVSYKEAQAAVNDMDYNLLVCSGISPKRAWEAVYTSDEKEKGKTF